MAQASPEPYVLMTMMTGGGPAHEPTERETTATGR